uniref:Uncharacterized protein n=1 Tax=Arundo donax TaxID=35708 RepID=A0A0A9FYA9_ARUDO
MDCFVQFFSISYSDTLNIMLHDTGCSTRCLCKVSFKRMVV